MRGSAPATGWWWRPTRSDGTFLKLPADVAIVTNIDPEHLDHFHTFEAVQDAFRAFVENIPFYGFAVMCTDHPVVQALVGKLDRPPHRHLRRKPAGRRAPRRSRAPQRRIALLDRRFATATARPRTRSTSCRLPMPGRHNALNATAAVAVAHRARHQGRRHPQGACAHSAASSAASPKSANGTAPSSSTTTAIIRSRSPRC